MVKKIRLFFLGIIIIFCSLNGIYAMTHENNLNNNNSITKIIDDLSENYTKNDNNISLISFNDNSSDNLNDSEVSNTTSKLNKSRPIYFAMDHTNVNDKEIFDNIVLRLESEGFNVVSAEIGPNKMSQNTHYLYENNISNAVVFHLFNGVDPSTIRELARNGTDNRGRIVRQRGNDVVLAWFYDSVDCVNENASGAKYVYGSETGPSLQNPREYMMDNDIIAICTSSDSGNHKHNADYTGEKTVEEFINLFEE